MSEGGLGEAWEDSRAGRCCAGGRCGLIPIRARVLGGGDLLQNGALHVEKLLGTAKPSFLRLYPAGISLLVFSSDIK